ncbi:MAG: M20/M25/M40 family metallo-hydrolase [Clostridia bacterium]|nr:M20/M25/M40 family metallo-hydrolase [Clostridia bacterium]
MENEINKVLEYFDALTKIPRPSGEEKAAALYLCQWGEKNGFEAMMDNECNVIINVPAKHGFENAPLTILQAHIDMVCVAEKGSKYNPYRDRIHYILENGYVRSLETSLGADDGIGIALAQFAAADIKTHGALRLIFTSCEETDLKGASALDEKYLRARYLINIDGECGKDAIISSAGLMCKAVNGNVKLQKSMYSKAFEISVSGLPGGHSGMDINKNIPNAISLLNDYLKKLPECAIVSMRGGNAHNAIPSECTAVIVAPEGTVLGSDEIHVKEVSRPNSALSSEETSRFFNLLGLLPNGVLSFFPDGSVQNSANIGTVDLHDDCFEILISFRSNTSGCLERMEKEFSKQIAVSGWNVLDRDIQQPWAGEAGELFELYNAAAAGVSRPLRIHAGLECGAFAQKNKTLEIISIGPLTENVHTTKERIHLDAIEESIKLIERLLFNIADKAQ